MTAEDFDAVATFEESLKVGDSVLVSWTNCGNDYNGHGVVHKKNAKSIVVQLTKTVCAYPAGFKVRVPRVLDVARLGVTGRVAPIKNVKVIFVSWDGVDLLTCLPMARIASWISDAKPGDVEKAADFLLQEKKENGKIHTFTSAREANKFWDEFKAKAQAAFDLAFKKLAASAVR